MDGEIPADLVALLAEIESIEDPIEREKVRQEQMFLWMREKRRKVMYDKIHRSIHDKDDRRR